MVDAVETNVIRLLNEKLRVQKVALEYAEKGKADVEIQNKYLKESVGKKNKDIVLLTTELGTTKEVLGRLKYDQDVLFHKCGVAYARIDTLDNTIAVERYAVISLEQMNTTLMCENMQLKETIRNLMDKAQGTTGSVVVIPDVVVIPEVVSIPHVPYVVPTPHVSAPTACSVLEEVPVSKPVLEEVPVSKKPVVSKEQAEAIQEVTNIIADLALLEAEIDAGEAKRLTNKVKRERQAANRKSKIAESAKEDQLLEESKNARILAESEAAALIPAIEVKGTPEYEAEVVRRVELMKLYRIEKARYEKERVFLNQMVPKIPTSNKVKLFKSSVLSVFEKTLIVPSHKFNMEDPAAKAKALDWVMMSTVERYGSDVWKIIHMYDNVYQLHCVMTEMADFSVAKSPRCSLEHISECLDSSELHTACIEIRSYLVDSRVYNSFPDKAEVCLAIKEGFDAYMADPSTEAIRTMLKMTVTKKMDSYHIPMVSISLPTSKGKCTVTKISTPQYMEWVYRGKIQNIYDICVQRMAAADTLV